MVQNQTKPKPRPDDVPVGNVKRESGAVTESIRPNTIEKRPRDLAKEFGDLEFRWSLDKELVKNPIARLGFKNLKGTDKVADFNDVEGYVDYVMSTPHLKKDALNAFQINNENELKEELLSFYSAIPEIFDNATYFYSENTPSQTKADIASGNMAIPRNRADETLPDDIFVDTDVASPRVWAHEMTHRGFNRLIEYKNQIGDEEFVKKYGQKALSTLEQIGRSSGSNEFFTEYFDFVDDTWNYPNRENMGRGDKEKFLDSNTVKDIEKFQSEGPGIYGKKNPQYGGLGYLVQAAEDILKEVEPPKATPYGHLSFMGRLRKKFGFDEGGLTQDDQMEKLDLARSYGVTVVDPEETSETVKALGKAALESIPGISTAATVRDIKEELQEKDPSWAKIGLLAASEAVGMIPGLGQAGKTMIGQGIKRFKTKKGSTYEVKEGNTTVRDKAARKENPGESGIQPQSVKTIYMPRSEVEKFAGLHQNSEIGTEFVPTGSNTAALRYTEDYGSNKAGDIVQDTEVKFTLEPEIGLNPVEILDFRNPKGIHFGNEITEVMAVSTKVKPAIKEGVPTIKAAGLTDEAIETWRKKNKTSDEFRKSLKGRNPELQELAKGVSEGRVFNTTYRKRADELRPIRVVKEVPKPATNKEIVSALNDKQRRNPIIGLNEKVSTGERVDVRLNIPAYTDYNVWIPTIRHDGKEKYKAAVRLKNVNFIKPTLSGGAKRTDSSKALKVAEGGEKSPFAVMTGEYVEGTDDELFTMSKEVFDSDEWTQVGYDPIKRGFFYDRETGQAILEADEVIQVGHLVLAKNAKKTDPDVFPFNKGGTAMKDQMQMAFKDDGMTKDPVSGNEVPPGSLAKEVRDDIPAMLSEGEYVVPADVLRFYGVNFFENLRNQAKSGLQTMENTGRIGGDPMSPQQVQQNMSGKPMAGSPPAQLVAANTGPAMLGQQSQTGTNTATTGQATQNTFAPMNFSTVGFSQFQQPNQKPTSVTSTKTYVNAKNTSDTKIVTYVDGAVTPPADVKFTQPPYYLMGSPALAEAIKGAPIGGGGGGGGGGTPDIDPPDPNEWIKDITDSESAIAWAEKNLAGDAKNLLDIFKLGTSVSRTRALAISAEARNDPKTAKILNDLASAAVKNNTALQFVPEGALNGTSNNSKAEKDEEYKSLLDKIFSIKDKKVVSSDSKDSIVENTFSTPTKKAAKKALKGSSTATNVQVGKASARGASQAEQQKIRDEGAKVEAQLKDMASGVNTTGQTGFKEGGLMQRKKKKGK